MKKINIALASDNNYAQHLGVALISILENSQNPTVINFHILENGINEENKEKLQIIPKKYGANIFLYHINEEKINNFPELGHLSKAAYLRLFLPAIIPQEIEKIIYLDCDLVALKDINCLNNIDLKDSDLGAVKDIKSEEIIRIYFYPGIKKYFNSGVMIINLKTWREKNITQKAIEFINEYKNKLSTADQDVLNCLFKDSWLELPNIYNVDLKHRPINSLPEKNTVILHYSDKIKPWSYLYSGKNKKYYFKYLSLSPWKNFEYKDKNLKNFFKKYFIAIKKTIYNILRPIVPNFIIDWNKRRFLKRFNKKI